MSPPDTARQHRLTPGEQERIFRGQGGGVRGGDGTRLFEPATTTPAMSRSSSMRDAVNAEKAAQAAAEDFRRQASQELLALEAAA